MKERIDIVVPEAELARNNEKRERLQATAAFQPTDRVPVVINTNQWGALAGRGRSFADYIRSPRDNLREQILNHKWRVETVWDDEPLATEALTFTPDFGCLRGVEFPLEITWLNDQPPKCVHPLTAPEQIDTLEAPPPDGGLNAKGIAWYKAMTDAAGDFDVRLNGEALELRLTLAQPGGPIPSAFALAGENLFVWMLTEPERAHRLMEIVTQSHLRCIRFFDEMLGRDLEHSVGMGADAAEMLSPETFREFVVPYYRRVWEEYPGPRSLHMCGKIDHLLEILRDELVITTLNGFGFPVDRRRLAQSLAGRVVLRGGPNPVLIQKGPREAVIAECRDYIETVGSRGGFILTCGGDAAADTPVEHFGWMVAASEQVGCPLPAEFTTKGE